MFIQQSVCFQLFLTVLSGLHTLLTYPSNRTEKRTVYKKYTTTSIIIIKNAPTHEHTTHELCSPPYHSKNRGCWLWLAGGGSDNNK